MDPKQLWASALVDIELSMTPANFITWFGDTRIVREEEGVVVLSVPNPFTRDWLRDKFHNQILKALRAVDQRVHALEYVINKDEPRKKDELGRVEGPGQNFSRDLSLPEVAVNAADNLNPRYTFDTFVIGPFNELAHAAARAVLKSPGILYNPLFIYGSTGHGKTHLIQAIGNHVKAANPSKKVYYMTSEKFGQECMNALQGQKMNVFKERYRRYDLLIIDDIQFFSGKEKFQEELFHLFNTYFDGNKQVIFSSDKHPHFITGLEERLKSRMAAGMIIDIPAPDQESRIAILSSKAKSHGLTLSTEVLDYLASAVPGNIRDLEGVVNTLLIHSDLRGHEITVADARSIVKATAKPKKNVAVKDIVKVVAEFYSIEEDSIYEKTRRKEVIKPRQVIMYLLREDFGISYPSIGQKLGGRDHTTVIHSCEKVKVDLKSDAQLGEEIDRIRNLLSV